MARLDLLDVVLLAAVVYGTVGVLQQQRKRMAVEEPGFQGLPARPAPPPSETDLELPRADAVEAAPPSIVRAFERSLIHDPELERRAPEYAREHAAGTSGPPAKATIRETFFAPQNVAYLRARIDRRGAGAATDVTLHEIQMQVYRENPGELPAVEVLGGNIPDTSKLCGCRAADPGQHLNLLNEETVNRLVAAVETAVRDQAEYRRIASAWTEPPEVPPSMKTENTAMEFAQFA